MACMTQREHCKDQYVYQFHFDHASNHEAFAADALLASAINLGWGGKQALMRDGSFNKHFAMPTENVRPQITDGSLGAKKTKYVNGARVNAKLPLRPRTTRFELKGTIIETNDSSHHSPGTLVIEFDSPIIQPM